MVKAVVQNGVIGPHDPLPENWTNGTEVEIDRPSESLEASAEIDRWLAEMEAIAAEGDPKEDRHLEAALQQHRREQKELARKSAELPE